MRQAKALGQCHVLFPLVVMVVCDVACVAISSFARHVAEGVPYAKPSTVFVVSALNLVRCCRRPPRHFRGQALKVRWRARQLATGRCIRRRLHASAAAPHLACSTVAAVSLRVPRGRPVWNGIRSSCNSTGSRHRNRTSSHIGVTSHYRRCALQTLLGAGEDKGLCFQITRFNTYLTWLIARLIAR